MEKELNLYTGVFNTITSASSLMAGFAFSGFMMSSSSYADDDFNLTLKAFFNVFIALALGLNTIAALLSTFVSMYGPQLALRGPKGSLERAVQSMIKKRKDALRFFISGVFCLLLASMFWAWIAYTKWQAILTTVVLLTVMGVVAFYIVRIPELFHIPREMMMAEQLDVTMEGRKSDMSNSGMTSTGCIDSSDIV